MLAVLPVFTPNTAVERRAFQLHILQVGCPDLGFETD
jgi:hypothetical protein